jgi:hypothetical protein
MAKEETWGCCVQFSAVCFSFFLFCCSLWEFLEQVPSLEHKNEVKGESLDLIKYIDNHFEGPSLFPDVRFGEKL